MVGSQDSVSQPNVVLNTIVAEAFAEACDELEKADEMCIRDRFWTVHKCRGSQGYDRTDQ